MENELRKAYKNIREIRLAKLRRIEVYYPTVQHNPILFKQDIEFLVEELIKKSNFGKIRSEIRRDLRRSDRSVLYGNGAEIDIKEYDLIKYAENFFEENLGRFGRAEIKLEPTSDRRHPYRWEASFEPSKE